MIEEIAIQQVANKAQKKVKLALIIGSSLVGVILLFYLFKRIGKNDLIQKTKKDIKKKNLTLDSSEYQQIASSLLTAMEGLGTDEETIYRNLKKLNTADDWKAVIVAFGIKNGKNLISYLIDDLDTSEKAEINKILARFNESI